MATENKFTLRYEGERISEGLEPHLFVEALRGFADFITTITESVYGSHADTTLKLHRLSEGSLVIEILQHLGEATVSDIVAVAASVRSEVEAVLKLLQHLRGSPPNRMERAEDNRVAVQNNSGQVIYFHRSTVNLVLQSDVGASVERFSRPITEGAAKELEVRLNDEPAGTVQENDADSMVSVAPETPLLDNENQIWLRAKKVVLAGDASWTFSDGKRQFAAKVRDASFLAKVEGGAERFGNGDRLLVNLKTTQSKRGNEINTRFEITKVIRHERPVPPQQGALDL